MDILNASTPHPAYPTPADVRRHRAAASLAEKHYQNNARIRAILDRALAELNACDLYGQSMAPGYDLVNIYDGIADMLPRIDNHDRNEALNEWAKDQTEGVS
jgi:hypothetical protein